MGKWGNKKFSIIFMSCLLCMLLLFCAFLDITFAWLYNLVEKENTGNSQLALVDKEDDSVTSTTDSFEFTLGATNTVLNLNDKIKIKNTGTTDTLLRVFYSIITDETQKLIATTSGLSNVSINNAFVSSDENIENVYSGHFYYNSVLSPNTSVSFINSITPTSELANKKVKLNIVAEFVNYQGGAYQLGQALPWKNTPAKWSFNYNNLTKVAGSTVSPKIDISFSEISKIELTAKTLVSATHTLFSSGNAHITMNTNWSFDGLINLTANLTPSQFANGDYNTVVFTWTSVTGTTNDYITLVKDSTSSKEISYKQIKIWNLNGELVYDLRPHVNTTSTTVTCSGKFSNNINGAATEMNMYTISGNSYTSTTSTYLGTSQVVSIYDFESGTAPACGFGASASIVSDVFHYGSKSLRVVNSKTKDTVTDSSSARLGAFTFTPVVGYKYYISMWVKTNAPSGALTYTKESNILFGELPALTLNSVNGAGSNIKANYTGNSNWVLISISTPVITTTNDVSYYLSIPTGDTYSTYVDDIVVRMYK